MNALDILLKLLTAANASTPLILALIQNVRKGVDDGLTEDQIIEQGLAIAADTDAITSRDMRSQP